MISAGLPWLTNAERMLILMKKSHLIPLLVILLLSLCASASAASVKAAIARL